MFMVKMISSIDLSMMRDWAQLYYPHRSIHQYFKEGILIDEVAWMEDEDPWDMPVDENIVGILSADAGGCDECDEEGHC